MLSRAEFLYKLRLDEDVWAQEKQKSARKGTNQKNKKETRNT